MSYVNSFAGDAIANYLQHSPNMSKIATNAAVNRGRENVNNIKNEGAIHTNSILDTYQTEATKDISEAKSKLADAQLGYAQKAAIGGLFKSAGGGLGSLLKGGGGGGGAGQMPSTASTAQYNFGNDYFSEAYSAGLSGVDFSNYGLG